MFERIASGNTWLEMSMQKSKRQNYSFKCEYWHCSYWIDCEADDFEDEEDDYEDEAHECESTPDIIGNINNTDACNLMVYGSDGY